MHTMVQITICCLVLTTGIASSQDEYKSVSGIYPHLAFYNNEGECGTGAVVPWAGRLWIITYGQHFPEGSSDKLYEIAPNLDRFIHPESIGGTPANRMIHKESNQLFIGPYAIDAERHVRVIPYATMYGRHTGNARHLDDPANQIYYATMEEGFYEVDVHSLAVKELYRDNQRLRNQEEIEQYGSNQPGAHGKGLYSGQGVLVYSNNGEKGRDAELYFDIPSGSLSEWDGHSWKMVRRNQFTEVTGPGGIHGNANPTTDPIWVNGWDHKSILVGVRNHASGWHFYRLPKASHSYDGAHGWNTEWPRIRNIGTSGNPDYLMTMHGMFWRFPGNFNMNSSAGIRPRSAYLKVIGDFCRWNDKLVFGCDDSAQKEFLNKRVQKGNIEGPGQSNSNLWLTDTDTPDRLGPITATGSVWQDEDVSADEYSEPFLFAGWPHRCAWIQNHSTHPVTLTLQVDANGNDNWTHLLNVALGASRDTLIGFNDQQKAEWVRVQTNSNARVTVTFSFSDDETRISQPAGNFKGLSGIDDNLSVGGLMYGLGNNRRALGIAATSLDVNGWQDTGYYELDSTLTLSPKSDDSMHVFIKEKFAIPKHVIKVDDASVLVIDDKGRRWRLPKGNIAYTGPTNAAQLRLCREVATERDLFNCHGTFYELPAENADGFAKIRPIASHSFRIHDYASYRGLLIMTGINPNAPASEHIIHATDGKAAVWAGVIDDLWKLGKPVGEGGPWKDSQVHKGEPSDPYLIGFYDQKSLQLYHNGRETVTFSIQVQPTGDSPWMTYRTVTVKPDERYRHTFPDYFQARWIRFTSDSNVQATAWLEYK